MPDQLIVKVRAAWWLKPITRVLVFLATRGLLNRIWVIKTCRKLAHRAIKAETPKLRGDTR